MSGVELDEAYYPKNRHADQVCKTFYRIVKEKKQPAPGRQRLAKPASRKAQKRSLENSFTTTGKQCPTPKHQYRKGCGYKGCRSPLHSHAAEPQRSLLVRARSA